MPEPTATVAASVGMAAAGATMGVLATVPAIAPQIYIFGVAIGLRADVLLAGALGAVVWISFFEPAPATPDTWRELSRTAWRRSWYVLASAVTAGYLTPLMMLADGLLAVRIPDALVLSVSFVVGAGAQRWLARFIKRADAAPANQAGGNHAQ